MCWKWTSVGLALVLFAAGCSKPVEEAAYAKPGLLMEPRALADSLEDENRELIILDARPASEYEQGHVPAARVIDVSEWKAEFGDGEDAQAWSQRIGRLGIAGDTPVVIYDDNASKDAARVWWILKYWGHQDARLLNGGWKSWTSADLPVSSEEPSEVTEVEFRPAVQSQRLADKSDVLEILKQGDVQIVDTRSKDEYCGVDPMSNQRGGAIPGAMHLEWKDLIDSKTDRFKPARELTVLFEEAGIDPKKPVATHCQSGGRASVMAFALELMGGDQVSNYYRGWSEWGNHEELPIELPAADADSRPQDSQSRNSAEGDAEQKASQKKTVDRPADEDAGGKTAE